VYYRRILWATDYNRVVDSELEPALFGPTGAGAVTLLRLGTKLKKFSFVTGESR